MLVNPEGIKGGLEVWEHRGNKARNVIYRAL